MKPVLMWKKSNKIMNSQKYDLGLLGGTIINSTGRIQKNIFIRNGLIAAITNERLATQQDYDVSNLLILPGMIDTHVHFMDPGDTSREDFPTGSKAAAFNGVTTVIEHTHSWPIRSKKDLDEKAGYLRGRSHVDFGLAAHVWPGELNELEPLWKSGINLFKIFTCSTHGVPGTTGANLREALRTISSLDGIALVHAEDEEMTSQDEKRDRKSVV